jgi:choline-glycine betaine transporter
MGSGMVAWAQLPKSMGSGKEPEPTHQEHGIEQVAWAHAPFMGAWMPSAWALYSVLGARLMHPSEHTPM